MHDCVFDAALIHMSNGDIAGRKPGNLLDRRLKAIEQVGNGIRRIRYNRKLLHEYGNIVRQRRNDVIEVFFTQLDEKGVLVSRSTLAPYHYVRAVEHCGWPKHDQHLLAAAINGLKPQISITERKHAGCAKCVHKYFGVEVENLSG